MPHQKSNPRPFNLVMMHHSHTFLIGLGPLLACTVRPKVVASTLGGPSSSCYSHCFSHQQSWQIIPNLRKFKKTARLRELVSEADEELAIPLDIQAPAMIASD